MLAQHHWKEGSNLSNNRQPDLLSFVPKFALFVGKLGFATGTYTLHALRRELWFHGEKILNQRVTRLGMRKGITAVSTC